MQTRTPAAATVTRQPWESAAAVVIEANQRRTAEGLDVSRAMVRFLEVLDEHSRQLRALERALAKV